MRVLPPCRQLLLLCDQLAPAAFLPRPPAFLPAFLPAAASCSSFFSSGYLRRGRRQTAAQLTARGSAGDVPRQHAALPQLQPPHRALTGATARRRTLPSAMRMHKVHEGSEAPAAAAAAAPRLDGGKRAAVLRAGAVPPDGLHMLRHAVALVPCAHGPGSGRWDPSKGRAVRGRAGDGANGAPQHCTQQPRSFSPGAAAALFGQGAASLPPCPALPCAAGALGRGPRLQSCKLGTARAAPA